MSNKRMTQDCEANSIWSLSFLCAVINRSYWAFISEITSRDDVLCLNSLSSTVGDKEVHQEYVRKDQEDQRQIRHQRQWHHWGSYHEAPIKMQNTAASVSVFSYTWALFALCHLCIAAKGPLSAGPHYPHPAGEVPRNVQGQIHEVRDSQSCFAPVNNASCSLCSRYSYGK